MKRPRRAARVARGETPQAAGARVAPEDVEALIDAALGEQPHQTMDELATHASPLSLGVHDGQGLTGLPDDSTIAGPRRTRRAKKPIKAMSQEREASQADRVLSDARDTARSSLQASLPAQPKAAPVRPSARSAPSLSRAVSKTLLKPQEDPASVGAPAVSISEAKSSPASASSVSAPKPAPASKPAEAGPQRPEERPANSSRPKAGSTGATEPPAKAAEAAGAAAPELTLFMPDMDAITRTMGRMIEYSGKVAAAYLQPRERGAIKPSSGEDLGDTLKTIGRVAESWLTDPARMIQAQSALSAQLFTVWGETLTRFGGTKPSGGADAPERKADRRFAAPEWRETPMFDFLHQAYLATTAWAKTMVEDAEGIDEPTREKAAFYLRQISSALSPANFLATNPELIKETFKENGENLVRGMKMLAEDIEAGGGELKIRQSDASKFKLGVDMATTPGKVVFRNDLMELLQYAPATAEVLKRPLLIVPPWINKFYVLDLNAEKSFIGWAVAQGLTVFVISWVNPDERHAAKDWDAYMREGILAALDAIETAIGERDVTTVGYCVGGTLLAATLAYMAQRGDGRVSASTFLTTQVDFEDAGDLKIFADEAQIRMLEKDMKVSGFLPGSKMATAFNMLRPDDLIWPYAVNTYLKGKAPAAFDLLAWNADSTRMTAANHAFYLRNCYLENRLATGTMVIGGATLNLRDITIPIYDLAAKEDHIAPAKSVFKGAQLFGGPVRYVMAGSGHIAGVVNPPAKAKYQHWTDGRMDGDFEGWFKSAREIKGTWWLDWFAWLKAQAPEMVPARTPGQGGLPALCDAPGEYVRIPS